MLNFVACEQIFYFHGSQKHGYPDVVISFCTLLVPHRSKTLSSVVRSMDGGLGGADRRGLGGDRRGGSFTHRSELSDSLKRANTQESNRLQVSTNSSFIL